MTDRIAEALQRLESDVRLSRQIAEKHTTIPKDRLDAIYRNSPTPTIFTPQEAKTFGIVEDIVELNPTGAPEPNVAIWTVGW